jgi:hypothetical protein
MTTNHDNDSANALHLARLRARAARTYDPTLTSIERAAAMNTVRRHAVNDLIWVLDALDAAEAKVKALEQVQATIAAQALNDAADAWDSPENTDLIRQIAAEHYHPGGPSMPALYLRNRAVALTNSHHDH